MDNVTEITCLKNEEKSCFNGLAVYGLMQEIKKSEGLLGEDSEIDKIACEDIFYYQEMIQQICQGCLQNKYSRQKTANDQPITKVVVPYKSFKTKDLERLAIQSGLSIGGGGEHGLRIVATDGSYEALPKHTKDVSPGVSRKILKLIYSVV